MCKSAHAGDSQILCPPGSLGSSGKHLKEGHNLGRCIASLRLKYLISVKEFYLQLLFQKRKIGSITIYGHQQLLTESSYQNTEVKVLT